MPTQPLAAHDELFGGTTVEVTSGDGDAVLAKERWPTWVFALVNAHGAATLSGSCGNGVMLQAVGRNLSREARTVAEAGGS